MSIKSAGGKSQTPDGRLCRGIFGFLMMLLVGNALAWGTQGHQVVAILAETRLSDRANAQINRLLALEPGATLVSISTWADEHKNHKTGPWHYVNFPRDNCTYDPQRDCPDGQCVVGVIERQLSILASNAPDDQRFKALKYILHLVADVHQPLHAGYLDDKGGNKYQVQAFGRGSNLHALWDSGLIGSLNESAEALSARLKIPLKSDLSVIHAAEESCRIVGSAGFYPQRKVEVEYVERFTPVMEQRLSAAAARLAGTLNRTFQ